MWSEEKSKIARRCGEKHILKSKCTKHRMFGPLLEVTISKNCTPLWREAHFEVKMLKSWGSQNTFWSSDVEKLHAVVARNTFPSQNVQKLGVRSTFWSWDIAKLQLWREAHFQVKMLKNWRSRTTFWSSDVEKLHPAGAKSTFVSQNVQNTCGLPHFLKVRCRKISQVVS